MRRGGNKWPLWCWIFEGKEDEVQVIVPESSRRCWSCNEKEIETLPGLSVSMTSCFPAVIAAPMPGMGVLLVVLYAVAGAACRLGYAVRQ